ncbi:formate dehydrogenase subunit gamma [Alsobacter sp. R-9]
MALRQSFRTFFSAHGILAMLALAVALSVCAPAMAQQPNNPTAAAVKEDQLLMQLRQVEGRVSIPDAKAGVLMQPGGDWRKVHNSTIPWVAGIAILGMLVVLLGFYTTRGRIMIEAGLSGLRILRFNGFERFVHWLTASCFIVLAISGLNVTFGRHILLPIVGPEAFTAFSQFAKYAHNYLAFPFTVGLVLMLLIWIADNIPNGRDVAWFKAGGGLLGKEHPPAGKFNGGQKMIFWSVILGGAALSFTGVILLFPFWGTTIGDIQLAQIVHAVVAALLTAVMLAHIYIGSIGMQGAFDAMGSGEVDINWAKEHHALWVEETKAKGNMPHAVPAE